MPLTGKIFLRTLETDLIRCVNCRVVCNPRSPETLITIGRPLTRSQVNDSTPDRSIIIETLWTAALRSSGHAIAATTSRNAADGFMAIPNAIAAFVSTTFARRTALRENAAGGLFHHLTTLPLGGMTSGRTGYIETGFESRADTTSLPPWTRRIRVTPAQKRAPVAKHQSPLAPETA